ncbi:MAG: hypothetical protein R3307_11360 [Anaerolineales bacterium]|nr:hypothetical protein [Anaerolineales bacterium]
MSRISKLLLFSVLIVFVLACNFVTQPIDDVQNLANTAESLATSLPIETLQALPSALPTGMPDIPDVDEFNYFDPQGTPLSEWNGIPIMPQATVGEEFNEFTYSFKANVTVQEAVDYYKAELANLGWSSTFDLPIEGEGGLMLYSRESNLLTLTFTLVDGETVVVLTLG